uniref:Uncharacterized protein n=1 Tax=viral metagenome TaxID=1070528 RepID=A0A6C0C0B8_9ZZZZ
MQIQLKNELTHAICAFEPKRSNWPNLERNITLAPKASSSATRKGPWSSSVDHR